MSLLINCPLDSEIPDIPNVECQTNFGQIVRIGLTRVASPSFATETDFALDLAWDTALMAADDTKVQFSPLFNNFVIPEGAAATIGPDTNETLFGELKVVGKTSITCTGRFEGLPFDVKKELEDYISEGSVYGNLGVFLIDEFGRVYGSQAGGDGTPVSAIPISSFFVGDTGSEGYNTLSYTPFQFNFRGGWVNDVIDVTPNFDIIIEPNV